MLNQQIHQMLVDVAEQAFPDVRHHKFIVKIENKELRSKNGEWSAPANGKPAIIRVMNLSRGTKVVLKTSLHELAHNTEYSLYRSTGHTKRFYEIYKRLLETAIEMNLININDIEGIRDIRILKKHCGAIRAKADLQKGYKQDVFVVKVKNSYNIKDSLSVMGYIFDKTQKCWSKEFTKNELDAALKALELLTASENITVSQFTDMKIEAYCYILVGGNTYPIRAMLQERGYIFNGYSFKKNVWVKKIAAEEKKKELANLQFLSAYKDVNVKVATL